MVSIAPKTIPKEQQNGHSSTLQHDLNARMYILALKARQKPATLPEVGKWKQCINHLISAYDDGPVPMEYVLAAFIKSNKFPGLKELIAEENKGEDTEIPLQGVEDDEDEEAYAVPALPEAIQAMEARAHEASPTLDSMIKLLRYWCTRSYDGYHETIALFVLDAIAARRLYLPWRNGIWTSLYFMLVADSTTHAKTEAASYGRRILEDCGLGYLLSPDEITPQKLMNNMAGENVPRNYAMKDQDGKDYIRLKLAFAGQRSWIYDEFGNKLQEIIQAKGHNAYFYALLKQLYDNKTTYEYDTLTRDNEHINMPYLSIIGTATPACLKPIASKQSAVWTDGMFARIAFVVPPKDELKLQSAPQEQFFVPDTLREKLTIWHQELGIPDCQIVDTVEQEELMEDAHGRDKKSKKSNRAPFEVQHGELPQQVITWTKDVYRAHEAYYEALATLARDHKLDERFRATYGRLPDMALKIAMLLSSLEHDGEMDMRHWARGQQITEHWRANFHELIAQLSTDEARGFGEIQEKIMEVINVKLKGKKANSYTISQHGSTLLRKIGSIKVREILDELVAAGKLEVAGKGKGATYGLPGKG